jgi:hypothetical protein
MALVTIGTTDVEIGQEYIDILGVEGVQDIIDNEANFDNSGVDPQPLYVKTYTWNSGTNTYTFFRDNTNKIRCSVNRNSDGAWMGYLNDLACAILYIALGSPSIDAV